jgi:uncharacterized RDD family membrane protein YckC
VEGDPQQQDERFAEWFVWAKREVSSDVRVCLAAAQAAREALEAGADEQAARVAARGSVAGYGEALIARIPLRRRAYAEWYDWARREVGGGRDRQHSAARAALDRLDAGADAASAAAAGRAAVGTLDGPPETSSWAPGPAPAAPAPPAPPAPAVHVAPVVTPYTAYQTYAVAPPRPPLPLAPSQVYAGFWRRFAAFLIDAVLLLISLLVVDFVGAIFVGFGLLSSGQDITSDNTLGAQLVIILVWAALAWLYYAGLESGPWQGTVGKRLLRLVVTDMYGRRIGFGRATGRYFAKILSGVVLLVGFLMVAFTERRQGLHDLMAGTLVVRQEHLALLTTPPQPAPPAQTGQPGASEAQGA